MIKFFRKIRFKSFYQNKLSKYFLYALGEIILVVIGILIALQINNWNEERKAKKSELLILLSLEEDFNSNLTSLQNSTEQIEELIETYSQVLEYAAHIDQGLSKKMKSDIISTGFIKTKLVEGTLTSILASSQLELIDNNSLKRLLTAYPTHMQDFKEQENDLVDYVLNYQRPLLRSYLTLSDFLLDEPRFDEFKKIVKKSDYKGLLKNQVYLNMVIGIRDINIELLARCKGLFDYTEEVLQIIEKEIDKV